MKSILSTRTKLKIGFWNVRRYHIRSKKAGSVNWLIREMKNNKLHALLPIRNKWMLGRTSQIAMKQSYTEAGETS